MEDLQRESGGVSPVTKVHNGSETGLYLLVVVPSEIFNLKLIVYETRGKGQFTVQRAVVG